MNRPGSRFRAPRSALALATAVGTFAVGALAVLLTQQAASAGTPTRTLGAGDEPAVSVAYDGSIALFAANSYPLAGYQGVTVSGPGIPATRLSSGNGQLFSGLTASGTITWTAYCGSIAGITCHPGSNKMSLDVGSPPPPPSSSAPGGGGTSTPAGGGSSTPASGSSGPSTGSSTPGHGSTSGGISIGPTGGTGTTSDQIPLGFGAPVDTNNPTPTIPNPIGTGVGIVPTGTPTSGHPSTGSSTQTFVLADSTPKSKNRPTSLAIVAIGALAVVASLYAYRRLGENAQRPSH